MSLPDSAGVRAAPMIDRVAARAVDLFLIGAVFVSLSLVIVLLGIAFQSLMAFGTGPRAGAVSWRGLLAAWHLFVIVLVVALGCEPFTLTVQRMTVGKAVTLGKIAAGLELRLARAPARPASSRRAVGRFAVSVGACSVLVGLSFAAAAAAGVVLTPWGVVGLVGVPSSVTWASTLVSALFRVDRRGWHDVLAGTMLVTVRHHRSAPVVEANG